MAIARVPEQAMPSVPDLAEPVEAWRVWRVGMSDDRIVLKSLFAGNVWEPAIPLAAECAQRHRSWWRPWRVMQNEHPVPDMDCSCGIYGVRNPTPALPYLEGRTFVCRGERVIGRVALWGDVVECQGGWRAGVAYPIELFVPAPPRAQSGLRRRGYLDEIVLALEAYRVPVDVVDFTALAAR
jgi:hypothetical protein